MMNAMAAALTKTLRVVHSKERFLGIAAETKFSLHISGHQVVQ